jgi:hypothetical protein
MSLSYRERSACEPGRVPSVGPHLALYTERAWLFAIRNYPRAYPYPKGRDLIGWGKSWMATSIMPEMSV